MHPWIAEQINQQHIAEMRGAHPSAGLGGTRHFRVGRINLRLPRGWTSAVSAARARVMSSY
jgi:hypothetical protein